MSELDADYERAGFGAKLAFGRRPALLLVDIVVAYVAPGSPLYAQPFVDALAPSLRLLAAARSARVPVVFTRVLYGAGGVDGGLFFRKVPSLACFVAGSELGAFPPGFEPAPEDIVVTKQYASAFFGTSLASTLQSLEVDTVVIAGFSTSGCVRASALDAMQHGFAPFVVRDACGDRDTRPHEANLFDLQAKYAEVVTEERALVELAQVAATRAQTGT